MTYHVVAIHKGRAIKKLWDIKDYFKAVEIQTKWLAEGANLILTDTWEHVRFDEVNIVPAELIWRR